MWMMGYNEEMNLPPDSFNGRKLRPLVPRPAAANPTGRLLSFNPHLGMIDQSKRELNSQQVVVASRWNPTPEQLQTLEELYQRGTRTPSSDQIQYITSQLRRYGKIEGKNVFYWFQNHKARERQKRRRQNESEPDHEQRQQCLNTDNTQYKEPGNNKTSVEIEHTKSCSTTLVPDLHQKTATLKAASVDPNCVRGASDGWLRFHDRDKFPLQGNATWHVLHRRFTNPTTATTPTATATINPSFGKSPGDQTLQLFPLRSSDEDGKGDDAEADTHRFDSSYQFFEFLPLKN